MTTSQQSRGIVTRIVITGDLVLTAPAHLGSGEPAGTIDMLLLRDALEQRPLLPGTSLAGALRGYLLARAAGYGEIEGDGVPAVRAIAALLGGRKGDDDGLQSPLIIDDALASVGPADDASKPRPVPTEVRDGVKIDAGRRTARDAAKYDLELLPAGTTFPLRFELLLGPDESEATGRKRLLAAALAGLEQGAVRLGARRSRGYGACVVRGWQAITYDLATAEGLLAWVAADHDRAAAPADAATAWATPPAGAVRTGAAAEILGAPTSDDRRERFTVALECAIDGSLLIRSDALLGAGGEQPDFVHLRDLAGAPLLPGTSLAGALRARALRIAEAVRPGEARKIVDDLFGRDLHTARANPTMSRLLVSEARIEGGRTLVQSRVSIDRFTGGALDTALFNEAPQFGGAVQLSLELRNPDDHEIGLLLLLIKDLWTGDLPIGGEASVGRGRLRGRSATLTLQKDVAPQEWTLHEAAGALRIDGEQQALEEYVRALAGGRGGER